MAKDRPAYEAMLVGTVVARQLLRAGKARKALWWCARVRWGYELLLDFARGELVQALPEPMIAYERLCARALKAMHAPRARGSAAVRSVARLDRDARWARRRSPPRMAPAAVELLRLGKSLGAADTSERLVQLIARLLAARVLFVRTEASTEWHIPQVHHTLNSWTMRRMESLGCTRAYRVAARPEFWRPEQHRPGAVLVAKLGTQLVGLARQRRFRGDEINAVRRVGEMLPQSPLAAAAPRVSVSPVLDVQDRHAGLPDQAPFRSKRWKRLMEQVWKMAPTPAPVVLVGETGTGKEVVARTLHLASTRARGPFVPVNCGAIHPDTLHSELFGHVRGAFTGATRNHEGLFLQAHRGTIFLDEIADMPGAMQTSLLRALEDRKVRPVGARSDTPIDVRVICATHRPLAEEVAAGRFREDLHHRLTVLELRLPPLRERLDDLPLLAEHLLGRMARPRQLHEEALDLLRGQRWPGNVRELDNVLVAAALLCDTPVIPTSLLADLLARRASAATVRPAPPPALLRPRQTEILRLMRNGWHSAPALAGRLGISTRTTNRELRTLHDQGLLEVAGEARGRRYRAQRDAWRDLSRLG